MPKIVGCLFAEDVREEASGQLTLVGVFTGAMGVDAFPFERELTPVFLVEEPKAISKVFVSITSASGKFGANAVANVEFSSDAPEQGQALLPLPPLTLKLAAEDEITVLASLTDENELLPIARLMIVGPEAS